MRQFSSSKLAKLCSKAEATRTESVGLAEAKAAEALGLARAEGFEKQKEALGEVATAMVAVANAIAEGKINIMPEVLVTSSGGSIEGLAATLIRTLSTKGSKDLPALTEALVK